MRPEETVRRMLHELDGGVAEQFEAELPERTETVGAPDRKSETFQRRRVRGVDRAERDGALSFDSLRSLRAGARADRRRDREPA